MIDPRSASTVISTDIAHSTSVVSSIFRWNFVLLYRRVNHGFSQIMKTIINYYEFDNCYMYGTLPAKDSRRRRGLRGVKLIALTSRKELPILFSSHKGANDEAKSRAKWLIWSSERERTCMSIDDRLYCLGSVDSTTQLLQSNIVACVSKNWS